MNKITQKPQNRVNLIMMFCIIMTSLITKTNAQTVTPWITSGDQTRLLQQQGTVSFGANSGSNPSTVTINAGTTYQTMDG
ncbi:beta-glucosidase, partial [Flavobacterium sp. LBUM151]